MFVLRTKVGGMWLFYTLFVCVFHFGLLGYYVLNWALWIIRSRMIRDGYGLGFVVVVIRQGICIIL